jgi:hypothetical protein
MQRKIYAFCLLLSMTFVIPNARAQKGKSEIAIGYGYYSVYDFVNHSMNGNLVTSSGGVPCITYRYYLNKNVTIGLGLAYEDIPTWGIFVTVAPEVTFAYLDTRSKTRTRVKLYGAASYGIALFQNKTLQPGESDNSGPWLYGFQATPIGVRVGRQFAGFFELGYGYKGIFHGGLALRFPQTLAHRNHSAE